MPGLQEVASSERGIERWEPFELAEIAAKTILDRHQEADRRGIRIDANLTAAPATRHRAAPPRQRARLGLAIVRAIAGVHGAALVANAGVGRGLGIEVRFP